MLFDRAGFWQVAVAASIDDKRRKATAAFELLERSAIPAVGDPAPRTESPVAGDPAVPAKAIDSRAGPTEPVPDPALHSMTVAAAIAAQRPVMVVVSTPRYCQSRFCGPITDSVSGLAQRHGDQMAFVHLEIAAGIPRQLSGSGMGQHPPCPAGVASSGEGRLVGSGGGGNGNVSRLAAPTAQSWSTLH